MDRACGNTKDRGCRRQGRQTPAHQLETFRSGQKIPQKNLKITGGVMVAWVLRARRGLGPLYRQSKRIQQRIADLFDHRHLFVRHHLTAAERRTLQRITRGLLHLRVLRRIMDEVYCLFDRRCRSETALDKLARLRRRVRRFQRVGRTLQKLFTPNLQKALTFLDDRLLPATSNAVERSNRRFRKAQRSIYSVRTAEHIQQRIALDMQRDQQSADRLATVQTLHLARSGAT